ncbi:cysteine sulfinic acid decarboxylase-like isoform X2 [Pomacea canaliculata]|uniref:cysteine sulfinic acid decarboxylase-like isoform X2 n=1 Tax=Pomacea canaliculata TaxID=400727 RepID=UPI000D73EE6C|nr:cysteine sulfinic acid decarboxylase-like isoform X2 [Pomacea canaliculata]
MSATLSEHDSDASAIALECGRRLAAGNQLLTTAGRFVFVALANNMYMSKENANILRHESCHPRFFNQLYSGIDPFCLAGSWLTDALNTNIHTYEVAGVFILVEQYLIDKLCDIVGYEDGDGLFCPGGSFSNMMAIHLARFQRDSTVREKGLYQSPRLRLYCSKEAHYSMEKAALFLGIGTDNVIGISTDSRGCMLPDILDMKILEDKETKGFEPTIVVATCGTTVLGAFDPLPEIAEVCKRHGVWLHVDACLGGGVLLSKKFKHRMAGIERSDSIAWNFHKMSHANIQCSVLLLKDKGLLNKGNGLNAEYLFQPDKCYDVSYDIGDRTVQCGRRVDDLKLWIMWKALGDSGMADNIENAFKNAEYFQKLLSETEGFRLVLPEFQSTNICFWYIPPSLRGQMETKEWWEKVGKVAPEIKRKMTVQGTMLIGYQPLSSKNLVNFFRIVILNPLCDFCDMDFVVSEIDRLGKDFIP